MATITCTNSQLRLIQAALDFYSRVGIGQFTEIKNHPTFERHLEEVCRPKNTPKVGDRTPQGEILEIKGKKALIGGSVSKKTNMWCDTPEWKKLEDVKLSTDYSRFHSIRDTVDNMLADARNVLINDVSCGRNGSWGIYNENVDDSCREAFEIIKKIRFRFWIANPNRSNMTVDSTDGSNNVKVSLDENS